jgi:hypothetical protein
VFASGLGFLYVLLDAVLPAANRDRMGATTLGSSSRVFTKGAASSAVLCTSTAPASRFARVSGLAGTVMRHVARPAIVEATAGGAHRSALCKALLAVFHHVVEVATCRNVVEAGFMERAPLPQGQRHGGIRGDAGPDLLSCHGGGS